MGVVVALSYIVAGLAVAASACSFGGDFDGTRYQCGAGDSCPTGQQCIEGYCSGAVTPDASVVIDLDAAVASARCGTVSLLADDFADSVTDGHRWDAWSDAGAVAVEVQGVVEVYFASASVAYAGYTSRYRYDLRDGEVRTEVTPGNSTAILEIRGHNGGRAQLVASQDKLSASVLGVTDAGERAMVPYDRTLHQHWRIREAGGLMIWETSPDAIAWTSLHAEPTPFPADHVHAIISGAGVAGGDPVRFASVNEGVVALDGYCPTATVVDSFDAPPLGPTWNAWADTGCTVAESGGDLTMSFVASSDDAWCGAETSRLFELTASSVVVDASATSGEVGFVSFLQVLQPGTELTYLEIARDEASIRFRQVIDDSTVSQSEITYVDGAHRYWRIREAGGRAYFETSPDRGTWTPRHDDAAEFDLDAVQILIAAGHYQPIGALVVRYGSVNPP